MLMCYEYDPAGNIIRSRDGGGHVCTYAYDSRGNMTARKDALGNTEYWEYDGEGNMRVHTDRRGVSTCHEYNMYGGLVERYVRNPDSEGNGNAVLRESYGYTGDGLLKYAIGGGKRYDYEHDLMGRLIRKSAGGRILLAYEYDAAGNVVKRSDVTGKSTEYSYDDYGRFTEVYDGGRRQAFYEYDVNGHRKRLTIGDDICTGYGYDDDGSLTLLILELVNFGYRDTSVLSLPCPASLHVLGSAQSAAVRCSVHLYAARHPKVLQTQICCRYHS